MDTLLQTMQNIFNNLGKVTITDDFIALREDMKTRLNQGGRNDYKFTKDVDCLMLEEWLIKNKVVLAPLDEHLTKGGACVYDARVILPNNMAFIDVCPSIQMAYVDFKCIDRNQYYNVSEHKMKTHPWVQKGIDNGLLTHYCFYQMHRPEDRPLRENDVVKFELINVLNAQNVLNSLQPSQYEGTYYKVPNYV